jgi:hypothetical protein
MNPSTGDGGPLKVGKILAERRGAKLLIRHVRLQPRINESLNWGGVLGGATTLHEACEGGYDAVVAEGMLARPQRIRGGAWTPVLMLTARPGVVGPVPGPDAVRTGM